MEALAELQLYTSRPFAPTRRLALGTSRLPVDPAPGPGGVLLGAVVARHRDSLDEDAFDNLLALTMQLQEGLRIVQPRLRNRFQEDRHGLTRSSARLLRRGEDLALEVRNHGTPLQLILGAVYAAGRLPPMPRRSAMDAIRKGLRWGGDEGQGLFVHLSGLGRGRDWSATAFEDPVAWALHVLGITAPHNGTVHLPDRRVIQRRFREMLRDAHPDHGGDTDDAAQRIDDLTEARRILLS